MMKPCKSSGKLSTLCSKTVIESPLAKLSRRLRTTKKTQRKTPCALSTILETIRRYSAFDCLSLRKTGSSSRRSWMYLRISSLVCSYQIISHASSSEKRRKLLTCTYSVRDWSDPNAELNSFQSRLLIQSLMLGASANLASILHIFCGCPLYSSTPSIKKQKLRLRTPGRMVCDSSCMRCSTFNVLEVLGPANCNIVFISGS